MIRGVKTKPVARLFGYRPEEATSDKLEKRVLTVAADGDLVVVFTAAARKSSKGQEYTSTWFDTRGSRTVGPTNTRIRRPNPSKVLHKVKTLLTQLTYGGTIY